MDVDHGQLVGYRLKDCPVVIGLHELSPIGRRAARTAGSVARQMLEEVLSAVRSFKQPPFVEGLAAY